MLFKYWWEKLTKTRKIDLSVKVLIIEDNPVDVKLFEKAVDICGYISLVARTGGLGVKIAREQKPNLIILDYGLPDMNGKEVLQILRKENSTVLVLSVLDSSEVILNSFENGAQYFKKPVDTKTLVRQITALVK